MEQVVEHFLHQIAATPRAKRYWVGFSGGLDSSVLLHLAATAAPDLPIASVHINHGLQPSAEHWAAHCEDTASALSIPHREFSVEVSTSGGQSVEDAAREARYKVFDELVQQDEVLLLAHHLDDQRETILMRMLRGAGSLGLQGMPSRRNVGQGLLLRPLLDLPRESLVQYCKSQSLATIEDQSNQDLRFDRNFVRHRLLPVVSDRWSLDALDRVGRHARDARVLAAELAGIDWGHVEGTDGLVDVERLGQLSRARQINVLRYWIETEGFTLPSEAVINTVIDTMILARVDGQPVVSWGTAEFRRYQGRLLLVPKSSMPCAKVRSWESHVQSLDLAEVGRLGLAKGGPLDLKKLVWPLTIDFRKGGEKIRPSPTGRERALKKLLQEQGVFPWVRGRIPLIYSENRLVAVADLWRDASVATAPGEDGWRIVWERDYGVSF